LILAAVAAAGYAVYRLRPGPKGPLNVVLVEICSLRYDHVGGAGSDRALTPALDALAARGTFFRRCTSAAPWTKPSTASLLTGLTAGAHGLYHGATPEEIVAEGFVPKHVLPSGAITIAEALKEAGYQTGGFVSNVNAWPVFGVHQGFDQYDCEVPRDGHSLVSRSLEWLDTIDESRPFFAFFLLYDAHNPYNPPYSYYLKVRRDRAPVEPDKYDDYWKRLNLFWFQRPQNWSKVTQDHVDRILDLYAGGVRKADDALATLLEALDERGLSENTLVLVVSDHGELFGEHDLTGHGNSLYEELIHVPLVIALPDQREAFMVDDMVSTLDLYPTILDLSGAEMAHRVQGRSLVPYLQTGAHPEGPSEYVFSSLSPKFTCVRETRWKLLSRYRQRGRVDQLFDLESARAEDEDLAAEHPDICGALGEERDRVAEQEEKLRLAIGDSEAGTPDEDAIRELKALGYL
jgi:arylsulfatase A-like enzyme